MFNLLPFEEKKRIRAEYRRRVVAVFLLFVILAELTATVLFVPTLIVLLSRESDYKTLLDSVTKEEGNSSSSFREYLKETTDKLGELSPEKNPASPTAVFMNIASAHVPGVHIERLSYKPAEGKKETDFSVGSVSVEGKADNREDLVLFKESLDRTGAFSSVALPISNLALDKDIRFSMTVNVRFASATPSTSEEDE